MPQTSDVERDVNLTIQAALHIVTKNPSSDLANSWNKVAVKWRDKLAVRIADKFHGSPEAKQNQIPTYSKYAYMLKFAMLSGNEEYYTMRDGEQTKSMTG